MWCVLRVRLPGGCGGSLRPRLPRLCPSLTLHTSHTPSNTPHTPSNTAHTPSNTHCRADKTNSNVYNSTGVLSIGRTLGWVTGVGVGVRGVGVGVWGVRGICTTPPRRLFWEREPKGGYGREIKKSHKELIQDGLKELRHEMSKWQDEMKETFEMDPVWVRPGDMDKIWVLDRQAALEEWVVTCDSDHGEGTSTASLDLSPTGHGLFSGEICTEAPKDGQIKRAGYCNMKSIRPRKSFKRDMVYEWELYNTLELRVRGDGRSYMLNIDCRGYFDIMWNDVYSYPLYTRGGPHWQLTRIPFSKFFLSSKGRVQDKQSPIPLDKVVSIGISSGDRSDAPFHLEIDYIGVLKDPDNTETFAYEMYGQERFMMGP